MFSLRKILFLLFILIIGINCVFAQDNSSEILAEGNIHVDGQDSSFNSINDAISNCNPNSVIYLSDGVYSGEKNVNLSINSNITIIGHSPENTVIDGEFVNYIFNIKKDVDVVLRNISFINAYKSNYGGAIYNEGSLTIDNCYFYNNSVYILNVYYPENIFSRCFGGGIYNNGTLILKNSIFSNNTAGSEFQSQSMGGAIYTKGKLSIENTIFDENKLITNPNHVWGNMELGYANLRGSALAGISDNVKIKNSIFKNSHLDEFERYFKGNQFSYDVGFSLGSVGGAIYYDGDNWEFDNCSFVNNSADWGGAVSYRGNNTIFNECLFLNNSASLGCGIFTLDYNLVDHYTGRWNGADNNIYSGILINNTKFLDNHVKGYVYNEDITFGMGIGATSCFLKIDDICINNTVFKDISLLETLKYEMPKYYGFWLLTKLPYDGGLLYTVGKNSLFMNSIFENGYNGMGGAIKDNGFNKKFVNCSFINNSAQEGGAVYHSAGDISFKDCIFINTTSEIHGGAIYSSYSNNNLDYSKLICDYTNCTFINSSASYGGAIYDNGDNVQFNDLIFVNCTANYGGAVYSTGFNKQFYRSKFVNCSALNKDYSNGGAIYNIGDDFNFENCDFINTAADNLGGSLYIVSNNLYGVNSSFINSTAFKGGSIYVSGVNGRLQFNTFNNTSAVLGGAIYNLADGIIISYNSIDFSESEIAGGAIYNEANNIVLYSNSINNSFSNDFANCIYTEGSISYLVVSFANNDTIEIADNKNKTISAKVSDNFANPITGGKITFILRNSSGEESIIGECDVIDGEAFIVYGDELDYGSYILSGVYSLASAPVLTQTGELYSFISTSMVLNVNSRLDNLILGGSVDFEIILIDSENNYVTNADISIYENGIFKKNLGTDDAGYVKSSFDDYYHYGDYIYKFIYNGDAFHGRSMQQLNLSIIRVNELIFKNVTINATYPFYITSAGIEIPFEFNILDNEENPLADISTIRYFNVYENGIRFEGSRLLDNVGDVYGTQLLYHFKANMEGKSYKSYTVSGEGLFLMPISKDTPGIYEYLIEFKGGLVVTKPTKLTYNTWFEGDNVKLFYNPSNISFILVVNHKNASIGSIVSVNASQKINEIDFAEFNISLVGSDGNFLADKEVRIYDSGVYMGSVISDINGNANFKINDYLDVGDHFFEFIYGGNDEYLASYEAFTLEVFKNPNKTATFFKNITSLNVAGKNNNFSAILVDEFGNLMVNRSVNVEIYANGFSKKYSLLSDENASVLIPLDLGGGNVKINCVYGGDRFYKSAFESFYLNVTKINTILFGSSKVDVVGEDTYFRLVLVNQSYYPLANSTIQISFYSKDYNISYYVVTNESGVASLKINVPVGQYYVLSSFKGDMWNDASNILTNVSVYGDYSTLISKEHIVFRQKGNYYTVQLTDSKGNPLADENVVISVNNISYYRVTDKNGIARLKINLEYGIYSINTFYKGSFKYKSSFVDSTLYMVMEDYKLPSVLDAPKMITFRESNGIFNVTLMDIYNNPLINQTVKFLVKSKEYVSLTNDNGIAYLNHDFDIGNYIVTIIYGGNDEYQSVNGSTRLKIVNPDANSTRIIASSYNVLKGKGNVISFQLVDSKDIPLTGEKLTINVNNVDYERITDDKGFVSLTINLNPGSYSVNVIYEGSENYFATSSISELVVIRNPSLKNSHFVGEKNITFIGNGRYSISLFDEDNNPIVNEKVSLLLNGVIYTRLTNDDGVIGLNVNLNPGVYDIGVSFKDSLDYRDSNFKGFITVLSTISAENLTKYYRSNEQFYAKVIDANGNPVVNKGVLMNINGVFYNRTTDSSGRVKLNINLNPGSYIITVYDPNINLRQSYVINVLSTLIIRDLVKVYKNASQYEIKVLDNGGNPLAHASVEININGVFYYRQTNDEGIAVLNINLERGKYIATVKDLNNGLLMSSNVFVVDSTLFAKPESTSLSNGDYLNIKFEENTGAFWVGVKTDFIINNKTYSTYTADDGISKILINLISGEYFVEYKEYLTNTIGTFSIKVT